LTQSFSFFLYNFYLEHFSPSYVLSNLCSRRRQTWMWSVCYQTKLGYVN